MSPKTPRCTGGWQRFVGDDLAGRTLGVLGLGNVGGAVARIGKVFGMEVIAWSQNLTADRAAHGAVLVTREELFRRADIVTVHLVLSGRTRGLVGAGELALMKPTARLVNTSRGPIVVEADLLAALRNGKIAGAGIDVFDQEPLPPDHPFRSQANLLATPHIGYVSRGLYAPSIKTRSTTFGGGSTPGMDADAGCNHFATERMMIERRNVEFEVAYEQALEPKKLVTIDGGHFDPYLGQFAAASTAAVSWFRQHVGQDQ